MDTVSCRMCLQQFNSLSLWRCHEYKEHIEKFLFSNQDKSFMNKSNETHILYSNKKLKTSCIIYGCRDIIYGKNLGRHVVKYHFHDGEPLKCNFCFSYFESHIATLIHAIKCSKYEVEKYIEEEEVQLLKIMDRNRKWIDVYESNYDLFSTCDFVLSGDKMNCELFSKECFNGSKIKLTLPLMIKMIDAYFGEKNEQRDQLETCFGVTDRNNYEQVYNFFHNIASTYPNFLNSLCQIFEYKPRKVGSEILISKERVIVGDYSFKDDISNLHLTEYFCPINEMIKSPNGVYYFVTYTNTLFTIGSHDEWKVKDGWHLNRDMLYELLYLAALYHDCSILYNLDKKHFNMLFITIGCHNEKSVKRIKELLHGISSILTFIYDKRLGVNTSHGRSRLSLFNSTNGDTDFIRTIVDNYKHFNSTRSINTNITEYDYKSQAESFKSIIECLPENFEYNGSYLTRIILHQYAPINFETLRRTFLLMPKQYIYIALDNRNSIESPNIYQAIINKKISTSCIDCLNVPNLRQTVDYDKETNAVLERKGNHVQENTIRSSKRNCTELESPNSLNKRLIEERLIVERGIRKLENIFEHICDKNIISSSKGKRKESFHEKDLRFRSEITIKKEVDIDNTTRQELFSTVSSNMERSTSQKNNDILNVPPFENTTLSTSEDNKNVSNKGIEQLQVSRNKMDCGLLGQCSMNIIRNENSDISQYSSMNQFIPNIDTTIPQISTNMNNCTVQQRQENMMSINTNSYNQPLSTISNVFNPIYTTSTSLQITQATLTTPSICGTYNNSFLSSFQNNNNYSLGPDNFNRQLSNSENLISKYLDNCDNANQQQQHQFYMDQNNMIQFNQKTCLQFPMNGPNVLPTYDNQSTHFQANHNTNLTNLTNLPPPTQQVYSQRGTNSRNAPYQINNHDNTKLSGEKKRTNRKQNNKARKNTSPPPAPVSQNRAPGNLSDRIFQDILRNIPLTTTLLPTPTNYNTLLGPDLSFNNTVTGPNPLNTTIGQCATNSISMSGMPLNIATSPFIPNLFQSSFSPQFSLMQTNSFLLNPASSQSINSVPGVPTLASPIVPMSPVFNTQQPIVSPTLLSPTFIVPPPSQQNSSCLSNNLNNTTSENSQNDSTTLSRGKKNN
uniref:C2H2-type domain-containing protein n=1 Tax=Parastrongyloides trichosuri TaxID=131310 RepID=A0A0N4ZZE8_PARTI